MNAPTQDELIQKTCVPCEGGVAPLSREEAEATVRNVEGWTLDPDGRRITRSWTVTNFMAGIDFLKKVPFRYLHKDDDPCRQSMQRMAS